MIINLKEIRLRGKTESDYDFDFYPEGDLCDIPNVAIVAPVKVSCTVYLTGTRQAVVSGEVFFSLKGECTSCLTETARDYVIDFEQEFSQENEYGYIIKSDAIDLTKLIVDEITLNMPINFVCGEDCKGIGKMEF